MFYRQLGEVPRKRHTQFRAPDGRLRSEQLMGREGFSSDHSLLYHEGPPTAIVESRAVEEAAEGTVPNHPVRQRHARTHALAVGGDAVRDRTILLANTDVRLSYAAATEPSPLYRNAVGDELVYVESGGGVIESVFGRIEVGPGDYVVVPVASTHRWLPGPGEPMRVFVIESRGAVVPPRRYLSERGQFLEHAPYCERDLRGPTELVHESGHDIEVVVRTAAGLSSVVYERHPFDVVGWAGSLYPYALSIYDFEPITGRLHQPPPVHQTFEAPGFVVCSFVPRLLDYHPEAIPVPYNHANVDSDEVLFYADGDFMSRAGSGIDVGSISYHPAGFVHGPQPGSLERSMDATETRETAVMLDTFRPLGVSDLARSVSDPAYWGSWGGGAAG